MKNYLIDTCIVIWLMAGDKRVNEVNYDMQYHQGNFFVSIESVTELIYLVQSGKIKMDLSVEKILNDFTHRNIRILDYDVNTLQALFKLPFYKEHTDPIDRKIIAQAIAYNCILISSDRKFTLYEPYGLNYIEV